MRTNDLKNIGDKYIFNRTVFKCLMMVAVMLTSVPYIHNVLGGYVKVLLVYGFLIIGYEIITRKFFSALRDKTGWLLIAFCASYAVTILININGNFMGDIKNLIYTVLFFSLFFMFTGEKTKEDLLKEIKIVSAVIIICTFFLSVASFITYMFSFSGSYPNNVGIPVYYGMFENRLWGVYNPNTGSTLNCISIVLSIIFIFTDKKRKTRVLNWINILLQYCVLLLTGSRAAHYVLFLILAVLIFFFVINKVKKVNIKTIGISALSTVVTVVLVSGTGVVLKEGLAYLPGVTNNMIYKISVLTGNAENTEEPEIEKTELDRIETIEENKGGFFSGRTDIWKACFEEFTESPIFGIGKENIIDRAIENFDDDLWKEHFKQGGTHNIYLCILLATGAVGFLIMAAFAVITLFKVLKVTVKNYNNINFWLLGALLLCIMFYITEFVEARILFQVSTFSVIFWVYCGYMYNLAGMEKD